MSGGEGLSISPNLGLLKNIGSSLKSFFGKGLGKGLNAGKGLLKAGGSEIKGTVVKAIATLVGPEVMIAVGATIVAAILILILVLLLMNYDNNASRVFPNVTTNDSEGPHQVSIGGNVVVCSDELDITESLAEKVDGGIVKLLPDGVGPRGDGICIKPGKMIVHWSGGQNTTEYLQNGNLRTYETLVARNVGCQLASDIKSVWFMQPFYETEVDLAWCADSWNADGISIEIAGVYFTDNPPPPNLKVLELSYDAVCKVNAQYNLRWCDVYGHYQVPDSGGKTDPDKYFLQNVFIPGIKNRCPNDPTNSCTKNQVDLLTE
jgi:hypothetical protein